MEQLDINLLDYKSKLNIKPIEGKKKVFDPVRKKFLILTPEEYVRQLLLIYLTDQQGFSLTRILVEKEIIVAQVTKRFDIVLLDKHQQPLLLIECKSHKHKLNQSVFDQVARYNLELQAPYLMISNGMENYVAHIDFDTKKFSFMSKFPHL